MRFEGTYIFATQRRLVWSYLHDPEILARAISGCEKFDQISADEFLALLKIQEGPFNGEYRGTVHLSDSIVQQEYSFSFNGSGPQGSIWMEGQISLGEKDGQTILSFAGELEVSGNTATASPRLVRTTANALIRKFFTEIDHTIQIQTGIYTTENVDLPAKKRRTGTISIVDVVEEKRQNSRTTTIVLILIVLAALMSLGGVAILVILVRWVLRLFGQYMTNRAQTDQQKNTPGDPRGFH